MELKEVKTLLLVGQNLILSKWRPKNGCSRLKPKSMRYVLLLFSYYSWRKLIYIWGQVVGIMRVNVEKVLERDQKLSELDDRAGIYC